MGVQSIVGGGATTLVFIIILCYIYLSDRKNIRNDEAPEPSGGVPLLGHIPLLRKASLIHRYLAGLADRYGPAITLRIGFRRIVVISSRELAKECFTSKNDHALSGRPQLLMSEHIGLSSAYLPFAPYGPYWRDTRRIMVSKFFSPSAIQSLETIWVREVDYLVHDLYNALPGAEDGVCEITERLRGLCFNIGTGMLFGRRLYGGDHRDERDAREIFRLTERVAHLMGVQDVGDALPFLRPLDLLGNEKAMRETREQIDLLMGKWVREHRQRLTVSTPQNLDPSPLNLFEQLISMENIEGALPDQFPSNHFIQAFAFAVLAAGLDPMTTALSWTISLLLNHRGVLEKAQSELDLHVGRNRVVKGSDMGKLAFLEAIVRESLRLYPPGPLLAPHEAIEDCRVGSFHVPKGTTVLVNVWKIQRDQSVYREPLQFRPERFLKENKEIDPMGHHYSLLPFGSGRRACPAANLAMRIMELTVARLIQAFQWDLPPGCSEIDMAESVGITANRKYPLRIALTPRLDSPLYLI